MSRDRRRLGTQPKDTVARKPPTRDRPRSNPRDTAASARRARLAQVQRDQRRRERRTTVLVVAACTVLVLLLAGVVTYGVIDARNKAEANKPENLIMSIGVPAASASCDPPTTDPATGASDHVGPGTNQPTVTKVTYATVPPSSGPHFATPAPGSRPFYTPADTPAVETLVHNLEHGYTVLWYLPSEATAKGAELRQLADVASTLPASAGKFIAAPWNEAYGAFPAGKKYALSHWSAAAAQGGVQAGHRQLCGDLSGEVVKAFVTQFPKTDAPEPNGA